MNILVTGATGTVGKNLLMSLDRRKFTIAIVIRTSSTIRQDFNDEILDKIEIINIDEDTFVEKVEKFNPTVLLHLASYLTSKDDLKTIGELINSNILFGSKILHALRNTNCLYFVNTGSCSQYYYNNEKTVPVYFYSATKSAFNEVLKYYQLLNKQLRVIQVVLYTVYGNIGKNKKVLDYILDSSGNSSTTDMSLGEQVLDFIHIDDIVNFYISLLNNIAAIPPEEIFHIGTGCGYSLREVSSMIEEITHQKNNIHWGALPYRNPDLMHSIAPVNKNASLLNWNAKISLKEGLLRYIKIKHDSNSI